MKMVDGVVWSWMSPKEPHATNSFCIEKAWKDSVPIVVVNKIDKPSARPAEVVDEEEWSSSLSLADDADQLDFQLFMLHD